MHIGNAAAALVLSWHLLCVCPFSKAEAQHLPAPPCTADEHLLPGQVHCGPIDCIGKYWRPPASGYFNSATRFCEPFVLCANDGGGGASSNGFSMWVLDRVNNKCVDLFSRDSFKTTPPPPPASPSPSAAPTLLPPPPPPPSRAPSRPAPSSSPVGADRASTFATTLAADAGPPPAGPVSDVSPAAETGVDLTNLNNGGQSTCECNHGDLVPGCTSCSSCHTPCQCHAGWTTNAANLQLDVEAWVWCTNPTDQLHSQAALPGADGAGGAVEDCSMQKEHSWLLGRGGNCKRRLNFGTVAAGLSIVAIVALCMWYCCGGCLRRVWECCCCHREHHRRRRSDCRNDQNHACCDRQKSTHRHRRDKTSTSTSSIEQAAGRAPKELDAEQICNDATLVAEEGAAAAVGKANDQCATCSCAQRPSA